MKIFVADRISPLGVDYIKKQEGFEVVEAYGSSPEEVIEIAKDSHAIIVRSDTQIDAEVIKASQKLKVIGRAGVGVDNIDIDAVTQKESLSEHPRWQYHSHCRIDLHTYALRYPSNRSWCYWNADGLRVKAAYAELRGKPLRFLG